MSDSKPRFNWPMSSGDFSFTIVVIGALLFSFFGGCRSCNAPSAYQCKRICHDQIESYDGQTCVCLEDEETE